MPPPSAADPSVCVHWTCLTGHAAAEQLLGTAYVAEREDLPHLETGVPGVERSQMVATHRELDEEYEKENGPVACDASETSPRIYLQNWT